MRNTFILTLLLLLNIANISANIKNLNNNWKFFYGDIPEAKYVDFDDSEWKDIRIPHDWAFENGYSANASQKDKGGYLGGGIGWYRKEIYLTEKDLSDDFIFIDFEASYMNNQVWMNGNFAGERPYGYIPFSFDIKKYLVEGRNIISVRVDNSMEPSARWYHGCGIYGNVSLRSHKNAFFEKDGIFITTPSKDKVCVNAKVISAEKSANYLAKLEIFDKAGKCKAQSETLEFSTNNNNAEINFNLKIKKTELWSPENPNLYTSRITLTDRNNNIIETKSIDFGFRYIEWSPNKGFILNGKQYKLRGVCEHMEGGPTGAITTEQLIRWKVKLLKDMGCNAIRTAHNPHLPIFYKVCDELGMFVMDEIFDGWHKKADFDYGFQAFDNWYERDLRDFIRRDRNHPSVFLYSIGNETKGDVAKKMVKICHEEDHTRLVTSGDSNSEDMDVYGVNGWSEKKTFLETYKPGNRAFIGTENPHTWQVRGYYRTQTWYRDKYPNKKQDPMFIPNLTDKEIFSYDWTSPDRRKSAKQIFNSSYDNATVRVTARHIIESLRDKDWFSGSFRWTGFDYLGEAGYVHGGWPFRAFQSGALDLAGFPKDLYFLYQSEWTTKDMVHILPHWTHPKMKEGTEIPVWVYTTGDEVELLLNGNSLGKIKKGEKWNEMQCEFRVPWTPGKIEAIAYRKGKEIARTSQATAGTPAKIDIDIENKNLKADCQDISIISISQKDNNGILYPYGENRIHANIKGDARILSFESGNPVDTETNFIAKSKRCFFGLNRIFIQSTGYNENSPVTLYLGCISGDKKLWASDKVSILYESISLRGKSPQDNVEIYYTTDGRKPDKNCKKYNAPFSLKEAATVKAVIYINGKDEIYMQESFGPNEGLYWGKPGEPACEFNGEQAETASLTNCVKTKKDGEGYFGDGFVIPKAGKGSITWYQENDGGKFNAKISIRYSQKSSSTYSYMELYNNDKLLERIKFTDTGSVGFHWREMSVPITIYSGANNITLKSVSNDATPSIDQITILQ